MKPNELNLDNQKSNRDFIMSNQQQQQNIKTEDSPATEALEFLLQNEDDSNSLMSDLTELIKRDPNMSTLTSLKTESDNLSMGMPIPSRNSTDPMMTTLNDLEDALSGQNTSSSSYNNIPTGASVGGFASSSVDSASPSMFQQHQEHLEHPHVKMEVGGGGMNDDSNSSLMKLELSDLDLGVQDYFINPASRNVSFGVADSKPVIVKPTSTATSFWNGSSSNSNDQNNDNLLFSTSSFTSQSGGATFGNKDLLSSSVPVNIFQNSPLSDILPDFSSSILSTNTSSLQSNQQSVQQRRQQHRNSPSVSPNLPSHSPSHAGPERHSTLHKMLARDHHNPVGGRPSPVRSPENRKTLERLRNSLSNSNPLLSQQLSQSAPSHNQSFSDHLKWSRREPRQHISSVCSVGESSSILDEVSDVLSGISPNELPDIESDDEEDVSQDDNFDKDSSDDSDDDDDASGSHTDGKGSKKDRHFWQYNVQAKGPKGQKIVLKTKIDDPHVLNEIVDPVFSGDVKLQGIKHSGKARRGDGNDLTSNPKKLAAIGKELDHLSKVINDLTPVSEQPFNSRCKSRKEKNKLASRACRLKKKAQHEANKLKCHGLEEEHHDLTMAILKAKEILAAKVDPNLSVDQNNLTSQLESEVKLRMKNKCAGHTSEYVNRQIEKYIKDA